MHPLHSLRAYTAHLFAKAALELFPQAKLMGGEVSEIGFSYSLDCSQPVGSDMIPLFEEKMRGWVKSPPEFRIQEMMPSNAASLFKDQNQTFLSEMAEEWSDELVPVLRLGHFNDIALLSELEVHRKVYFSLLDLKKEGRVLTVQGTAFNSPEELKSFIKVYKEYSKKDGFKRALQQKIMMFNGANEALLMPKGLEVQSQFYNYFYKTLPESTLEVKTPYSQVSSVVENHAALYENNQKNSIAEWRENQDLLHAFVSEDDVRALLKSSLQLIEKTSKIFGFEYHGTLCGLSPPKFENRKRVKDQWKSWVSLFKETIVEEGLSCSYDEDRLDKRGPEFHIRYVDALGRSYEGPKLSIDCITLEAVNLAGKPCFQGKVIVARELFPNLQRLMIKLIEEVSLNNILRELGR